MRTGAALRRLAGVLLLAGGAAAPAEHLVAEVSAPKERGARRRLLPLGYTWTSGYCRQDGDAAVDTTGHKFTSPGSGTDEWCMERCDEDPSCVAFDNCNECWLHGAPRTTGVVGGGCECWVKNLEDDVFVENIACGETRHESTHLAAHWLSGNDAPDHFYLITPSETAYYHFSTCGSDYDTMLYLYDVVDHEADTCLRSPAPHAGANADPHDHRRRRRRQYRVR